MNSKSSESELFFSFLHEERLRIELTKIVKDCKSRRIETQKQVSDFIGTPLTKIKQVEKGTCKDINAINNYIAYMSGLRPVYIDIN